VFRALVVPDDGSDQVQVSFPLGFDPQVVEIGGVALTNHFKTVSVPDLASDVTHAGRASDASSR
jgi:hypothetical protein